MMHQQRDVSTCISVHQRASVQVRHERFTKVHQTCTKDAFGRFASTKSRVIMSSCRANVTHHLLTCWSDASQLDEPFALLLPFRHVSSDTTCNSRASPDVFGAAPHWRAAAMESAIERLAREGRQPMIEGIRRTDEQGLRYFIVNMVDGKLFAWCPNADDPNKHGEWLRRHSAARENSASTPPCSGRNSDALFVRESQSFLDNVVLVSAPADHGRSCITLGHTRHLAYREAQSISSMRR
jgi:hypothetical protein